MRHMITYRDSTTTFMLADIENLSINTMSRPTFTKLKDDLLDTAHTIWEISLEKMQNLDH